METPRPEWDVVVIGTGMGGSAAGAICALHGLKTLILEKNPRPGGACSYYEKQGFHVDTGTHLFIRGNKGPFGVCTQRLGMGLAIDFTRPFFTTQFRGMGADVIVPKYRIGMAMAGQILAWQLRIPIPEYPKILRLFTEIYLMKPHEIEALDKTTVEEFIKKFTNNPQMRAMLALLLGLFFILPPWQASAGESVWNLQKFIKDNNLCYPKGGAVAIPKAFLAGAEKHGAWLRLNAGVKKIEAAHGRVRAVVLENGERVTTRAVISTTALKDTVLRLAGPGLFPKDYVERVKGIKGSMIAVQAKIGLNKRLLKAGSLVGAIPLKFDPKQMDEALFRQTYEDMSHGRQAAVIPIYAPIPTNYDPSLAPEGCQLITAVAGAPTLDVDLVDPPSAWIEGMMRALRALIPGLDEHTIFCDTWSVENIASWIGKSDGAAVTTGQTTDQVGVNRPGHRTPVAGLYIAGDCGGPARGVGTELACQSGMDCADLVAGDMASGLL